MILKILNHLVIKIEKLIFYFFYKIYKCIYRNFQTYYFSRLFNSIGKYCKICGSVLITGPENINFGHHVSVNENVVIQSCEGAKIFVGDYVTISYGAMLITGGLVINQHCPKWGAHIKKNIVIDNNVWIGAGSIILPGVHIGTCSVVAAGSVVTRDVEPYTIVGGCPSRIIKSI